MTSERSGLTGLESDPFDYRVTRKGEIHVRHGGRAVAVIRGRAADKLAAQLGQDPAGDQLLLAKATGNYKRGNERR